MVGMLVGSARARAETMGDASSCVVQDPHVAIEHAAPVACQVMEVGPRRPVRAQ